MARRTDIHRTTMSAEEVIANLRRQLADAKSAADEFLCQKNEMSNRLADAQAENESMTERTEKAENACDNCQDANLHKLNEVERELARLQETYKLRMSKEVSENIRNELGKIGKRFNEADGIYSINDQSDVYDILNEYTDDRARAEQDKPEGAKP